MSLCAVGYAYICVVQSIKVMDLLIFLTYPMYRAFLSPSLSLSKINGGKYWKFYLGSVSLQLNLKLLSRTNTNYRKKCIHVNTIIVYACVVMCSNLYECSPNRIFFFSWLYYILMYLLYNVSIMSIRRWLIVYCTHSPSSSVYPF